MIGERIFLAAFVGAIITDTGLCGATSKRTSHDLATTLLRAACAGYMSLCILGIQRTDVAFAAGLAYDILFHSIRSFGSRLVRKEVSRDQQ